MGTSINDVETTGLKRMRQLNQEFLCSGKGSDPVRSFLTKIEQNQDIMLIYLKGRKYRPEQAWETLKRKAEVRFDEYPEAFLEEIPRSFFEMQEKKVWGVLKNRDSFGRRIICLDTTKWNPKELTLEEITIHGVFCTERLLHDEDAMNNGVVVIQNCEGMGMAHAKFYSLHAMLRMLNIYWYACPLQFKGLYVINVPFYLMFLVELIRPFMSSKIKERLHVSTRSKKFTTIHQAISVDTLPEFLGGNANNDDPFDFSLYQ